jgi:hypothetical protein
MSSAAIATPGRRGRRAAALPVLARIEMLRYARHPLFILGVVLNVALCAMGPSKDMSSLGDAIAPAAGIGIFGIVIMASLTRSSERIRVAAGVVPVGERTRTLALVAACLVPFAAGLAWWIWAFATYRHSPPAANGFPFGPVSSAWVAAVLFGQGPMATLGGPLLGLLVGRWLGGRATPAITAVATIMFCIAMQGLFVPLRRIRVISPWTYWGGPFGVKGDANRMLLFTGSPYWWVAYLACICLLGAVVALLHDRDGPRRPLLLLATGSVALAVATVLLAMWAGTPATLVNPLHS